MRAPLLGCLLTLALSGCSEAPAPVFGPVIVLHPPLTPPHPRPRPGAVALAALPVPPMPPDTPDPVGGHGSVVSNLRSARQLAAAYVAAPGTTTDGIQRARVLQLTAERATWLMLHHHPPRQADADHATAAVSELLELVGK